MNLQKAGISRKETGSSDKSSKTWPGRPALTAFLKIVRGSGQQSPRQSSLTISIKSAFKISYINGQQFYKNFKKKSEGTFKFLDIHSSEAKKYLESNSYFIKNFKPILPITNGEIAIYEDDDKLAILLWT